MAQDLAVASPALDQIAGEAYGVRARISADSARLLEQVRGLLPPGWINLDVDNERDSEKGSEIPHFTLTTDAGVDYMLTRDDVVLATSGLDVVLGVLDAQLRGYIALHSPDRIFVHAGVVGYQGQAIVVPGPSFSGKTTLVAELVRAGAVYYSDEYAVLDDRALIHPYPKPLSIRTTSWSAEDHHVSTLGGSVGSEPLPLGLVVVTQYRSGATWEPHALSPGEALLALLANTVPAQERPQETMTALRSVIGRGGIVALEGDRGEAADMVQQLLERAPA